MKEKIIRHLSTDSVLRPVVQSLPFPEQNGERIVYDDLLRSIVGQQLSVKAARTIHGRFLDAFGGSTPAPSVLKETPVETLRLACRQFHLQKGSGLYRFGPLKPRPGKAFGLVIRAHGGNIAAP